MSNLSAIARALEQAAAARRARAYARARNWISAARAIRVATQRHNHA